MYQQIVNGTTTTYQLDLAGSLVQVLADGEQAYVYGLEIAKQGGRTVISQVSETQTGYYLPDVMGSVRQMTSEEGDLLLAQSYSPYGEELEEIGRASTPEGSSEPATFGYAGQLYDDQTGLLFLRARYYSPSSGRFISHDTWEGDAYMPMSYNMWLYGYGNLMRYTDPSGNIAGIDTLLMGLVGGAVGTAVGAIAGSCTYDLALTGQCGCYYKQKALSMSRSDWSSAFVIAGAAMGGLLGMAATSPTLSAALASMPALVIGLGVLEVVVGAYTFYFSATMLLESVNTLISDGLNWCNFTGFVFSIGGMFAGTLSVLNGASAIKNGVKLIKAGSSATSTSADDAIAGDEQIQKYWKKVSRFRDKKVYQRNDLFDINEVSRWRQNGKYVTGTNLQRMQSGRAPIGYDGKSVVMHHLTQTETGAVAEVSQTFHQKYFSIIHSNTGQSPSQINRSAFNTWTQNHWSFRALDFIP